MTEQKSGGVIKTSYRARTGHERFRFCKKNQNAASTMRRVGALSRLKKQMDQHDKALTEKDKAIKAISGLRKSDPKKFDFEMKKIQGMSFTGMLSERDFKRITQEMTTLQNRIGHTT